MAEIGVTEVSATSQDYVSALVQMTLKEKSHLIATVTDYSSQAGPGAKSVKVPRRSQFAAADKIENTNLTSQELTFAVDTISLNKHKAIYAKLERIAEAQSVPQVQAQIITEMAEELALQLDKDIFTQLKLVSTAAPDHLLDFADTAGDKLAIADFGTARSLLRKQNVPMMDGSLYCLISPDQEKNMLNIANFISAEQYGGREALLNGEIGRVFGFKILVSTILAGVDALFYHSSHVGWALQGAPEFKQDYSLQSVSDEFLLNQIYGVNALDSGKRGVYFNGTGS